MGIDERQNLIDLLEKYQREQGTQHKKFAKALTQIEKKLDRLEPVAAVYENFKGFGSISMGVMKWIIIPLSIVVGLVLSIKKLWFN